MGAETADWELPRAIAEHVDPAYRSFVRRGWRPILERLHDRLSAIDPDYRLHQVKEKMGTLRIYADEDGYADRRDTLAQIEAAIGEAARASALICERCGRGGTLRRDPEWRRLRGYLLTLCDRCAARELAERGVPTADIDDYIRGERA